MYSDTDTEIPCKKSNILTPLLLFMIFGIYIALRIRWIGHLLAWDEAMELCSARAFISGGEDFFSNWFWRHPPLFPTLMLLLKPLQPGFAERSEYLALIFGLLNMGLLFMINRRIFNDKVALWSIAILALMPGSAFFDVWIKRDHAVTFFGLLSILLMLKNRVLFSALCLGFAFLSKETAIFYFTAMIIMWAIGSFGKRKGGDLIAIMIVPLLASGWWFLMESASVKSISLGNIIEHTRFASGKAWIKPWNYYFYLFYNLTGKCGALFIFAGGLTLAGKALFGRDDQQKKRLSLWPLALFLPAILLLTALKAKVPWIVITLLPALATIGAVAISEAIDRFRHSSALKSIVSSVIILILSLQILPLTYERIFQKVDYGQWCGSTYSQNAATAVNNLVRDDERILLSSFHYWKGLAPKHACPVFTYYLTRHPGVIACNHDVPFEGVIDYVLTYNLDWVLLSPEPGKASDDIYRGFIKQFGIQPLNLKKQLLFRTKDIYTSEPVPIAVPPAQSKQPKR